MQVRFLGEECASKNHSIEKRQIRGRPIGENICLRKLNHILEPRASYFYQLICIIYKIRTLPHGRVSKIL